MSRLRLAVALATSAVLLWPPGAQAAVTRTDGTAGGAVRSGQPFAVTLITGDKVRVTPVSGGKYAAKIEKAKGRERIPFVTQRTKNGLSVIPADAVPALAADRLDPRLFDVLLLQRLGYDDSKRKDLPLMTSGAAARSAAPAGTRSVRALPKLGISVLRAEKRDTATLWKSLRTNRTGGKLWLVGKLRTTLDASVPQVGAPAAWRAGHTGKGVKVAVLDTGYDANHPDLKGAVVEARDFSGSEDGVKDMVGHGTHVASTIAGRGTASGGKYTGVAKGAQLSIGKVCTTDWCTEDAILAGMEWAATSGAKVVNMSLGGPPSEGFDLLAETVNSLSRDGGPLFVIAAGNEGAPESIGSPGTADEALTVGSVTKADELSWFSSQGPRVVPSRRYDYAVKPDITAPGQDIVAARAEGTLDDVAVDRHYAQLSGTSMATPHVAGAAAIVAGQHPDWTGAQIKAALASTAKPKAGLTVYQQGAGRLDVARATAQKVTASAGTLSLGYFPWRSSLPAAKKSVTYTNSGTTPVTLKLGLGIKDDKGKPAARGMFTASASTVTVPAGRTASVTVTVKPTVGAVGLYSGALTATSADGKTVLTTGIGAYKEPESYNASLTAFDRTGRPSELVAMFVNRATGRTEFVSAIGGAIRRLPRGDYTVAAALLSSATFETTMETQDLRLRGPAELQFDARRGKQVTISVDRPDAVSRSGIDLAVLQSAGEYGGGLGAGGPAGETFAVPGTERIPRLDVGITTTLVKAGSGEPDEAPTPYTYNLAVPLKDRFPARPNYSFTTAKLAAVTRVISRQGADEIRDMPNFVFTPANAIAFSFEIPLGQLRERVDYQTADPRVRHSSSLVSGEARDGSITLDNMTVNRDMTYESGKKYREAWNAAAFGPSALGGAYRNGNDLEVWIPVTSDNAPDHASVNVGTLVGSTTLRRGGAVIASSNYPAELVTTVPAAAGTYRLETTVKRNVPWTSLSPRVDAAWTFRSAHVPGDKWAPLTLPVIRYRPALDIDNNAPRSGRFSFPVVVERPAGAPVHAVKSLKVEVSYDGGKTWKAAKLSGTGDQRTATVQHPGTAGHVSLRATAEDTAGNKVEQTIRNAYALK